MGALAPRWKLAGSFLLSFCLTAVQPLPQPSGTVDSDFFLHRALRIWMETKFLDPFSKYHYPHSDEVQEGSDFYQREKVTDFKESGASGIITQLPLKKLGEVVDTWKTNGFVSEEEAGEMKGILAETKMFKTIREHVNVNSNGVMIFGITGFLKLSSTATEGMGSLFYSFRSFKLKTEPFVAYDKEQPCHYWGSLCFSRFHFDGLFGVENNNLASFMISEALNQFDNNNPELFTYLRSEADKYKRFLPSEVTEALEKMEKNVDSRPDEIFEQDPLDGNKFHELYNL